MMAFPPLEEDSGDRCSTCRYWDKNAYDPRGLCRINPPQTFQDSEGNFRHGWPETRESDWCGQFAASNPQETSQR